jgi:hypothetical protein
VAERFFFFAVTRSDNHHFITVDYPLGFWRKRLPMCNLVCIIGGSGHAQFKHPIKRGLVTIPIHDKDMKKGSSANVLRQAGLKQSEV